MTRPSDLAFVSFAITPDEIEDLVHLLFSQNRRTYEQQLAHLLRQFGYRPDPHYLTDKVELEWLMNEARLWGAKIAETINRDLHRLAREVEEEWQCAHGNLMGLTRAMFALLMREKIAQYLQYKVQQIAITELSRTADHAALTFAYKNSVGLDGYARVVPLTAVCDICQGYVDMGWLPIVQAMSIFQVPAHPNCPHMIELDIRSKPDESQVWRG